MKRQTDYGYDIKPVYTPKDIADLNYERDVGDPSYPFVRGYYPNGYAPDLTRRMTAGLALQNELTQRLRCTGNKHRMLSTIDHLQCR